MKDKKQNIEKAIESLPKYKSPDRIWDSIEAKLNTKQTDVDFDCEKLPVFEAPERIWDEIEKDLHTKETRLQEAIAELPRYKHPVNGWGEIEQKLKKTKIYNTSFKFSEYAKVAAIIVAICTAGLATFHYSGFKSKLSVINESVPNNDSPTIKGIQTIYNSALCQSNPEVCKTDLFKSLSNQLDEVKTEIEIMRSMLKNEDPQLTKYYHRLINQRVDIEMKMMRIIQKS